MMALDLLFLIHQLDDLIQLLSKEANDIVCGDDANQDSLVVDDGKAANAALLHHLDRVGQTRAFVRGQEIVVDHVANENRRQMLWFRGDDAEYDVSIGQYPDRKVLTLPFFD